MKAINQIEKQTGTFKEEKRDLTAFMSISLSPSDKKIAPSTSKQTETVQTKSFSKHSIQKKKAIKKKRNFFGTKFAFKKKSRRLFVSKSAAYDITHLYFNSVQNKKRIQIKENQTREENTQLKESTKSSK